MATPAFQKKSKSCNDTNENDEPVKKRIKPTDAPDWQMNKDSLKERNKHMFNNSLISDVKFSVKDSSGDRQQTVVIPAHKYILAISSPVFFKMFYGELTEPGDIIQLPDCNSESFLELLRFIYCDEVELTGNNVIEVLYLAKKYMIPSLSDKCLKFLQEYLNNQNVFSVLPGVLIYEEKSAIEKCWKIVDEQTEEAMNSEAFLDISHELLSSVLERDTLRVQEVAIFKAVDRWAAHKCGKEQRAVIGEEKRKVLGDAVNLIRFPLMGQKEFSSLVPKTNILPKEDMLEVFLFFNDTAEVSLKCSSVPRRGSYRIKRAVRFKNISGGFWTYDGRRPEMLAFSVNREITIHGVRLFGCKGASYSIKAGLSRKTVYGKLTIAQQKGRFETDKEKTKGYYGYDVFFEPPVAVKKNERYELSAVIEGRASCFGNQGQAKVAVDGSCFSFSVVDSVSNWTRVDEGQFAELLFL